MAFSLLFAFDLMTALRSTETCNCRRTVPCQILDILKNIDNQRVSLLVLLDLSATFDTLDVNTLQQIFQNKFMISSQVSQWFQLYFTNRQQRILIKDVLSNEFEFEFEWCATSCAGPVILLSYLSSLYDLIPQYDVNVGGFADDNQLYISFKPNSESEAEALNEITNGIAAVRKWILRNKLKINDDKTELIIIGGSKQLPKVSLDSIQVGECTVSPGQNVRNLGVIFDENLSMKDHVSNVCKKVFYQLHRLRQVRKYFNRNTFECLVHTFMTSHIDYGNAMLFGLPDVTIKKLQRLQHATARLILNRSWRDSDTEMLKE